MANRNSKRDRDGVMKGMPQPQSFELQWGGIVLKDGEQICLSLDTAKKAKYKSQLEYKRASPRTLPNSEGAAGSLFGWERLTHVVYTLPLP